jgi:hypothetical protein
MRSFLIFFFLLLLINAHYAQTAPNKKTDKAEDPSDLGFSIPNSAVLITIGGSQAPVQKHGTGFLMLRRDDEGIATEGESPKPCRPIDDTNDDPTKTVPCRILLVTNKHMLPAEGDDSPIFMKVNNFSATKKEVSEIELHILDDVGRYLPSVKIHPGGYDIAVVDVTRDLDRNKVTNFKIFSTDSLAVNSNPPKDLRALPAALGDTVYILGYPSGIYDPRNAYPILRSGIIATNPHSTFEFNSQLREKFGLTSVKGFLIDAAIFPGSSGSLVLRKPINYEFRYAPYALGIISDSIPIEDLELKSTQRMGLAVVYSSDAILETLALFK